MLFSLFGATAARAQSGVLIGTTTDAFTHEPLAGVLVTVVGADATAPKTATTDSDGNYRIADLAPGTYAVQSAKAGYHTFVRRDVQVRLNRTLRINAELLERAP
nr:carboxypeptidase-like regulatory domain-containing protein [Tahibacter caeni]